MPKAGKECIKVTLLPARLLLLQLNILKHTFPLCIESIRFTAPSSVLPVNTHNDPAHFPPQRLEEATRAAAAFQRTHGYSFFSLPFFVTKLLAEIDGVVRFAVIFFFSCVPSLSLLVLFTFNASSSYSSPKNP